jgi:hypothetical protein
LQTGVQDGNCASGLAHHLLSERQQGFERAFTPLFLEFLGY